MLGWGDANMQQVLLQKTCGVWMGVWAAMGRGWVIWAATAS